jgi:hypothetical protein
MNPKLKEGNWKGVLKLLFGTAVVCTALELSNRHWHFCDYPQQKSRVLQVGELDNSMHKYLARDENIPVQGNLATMLEKGLLTENDLIYLSSKDNNLIVRHDANGFYLDGVYRRDDYSISDLEQFDIDKITRLVTNPDYAGNE